MMPQRILGFNPGQWLGIVLLLAIMGVGLVAVSSASQEMEADRAFDQFLRMLLGLGAMLVVAKLPVEFLRRWSVPLFMGLLVLLILVPLVGQVRLGAQRWLVLGPLVLQPSEPMKIALILMLARLFAWSEGPPVPLRTVATAIAVMTIPTVLIARQPDLGTALLLFGVGSIILFAAGVSRLFFMISGALAITAAPVMWMFGLKDYQKQRILTFINPESDPFGSGYHILQSKIAVGSGGVWGKGYGEGTQSHLQFLPERHTDFIFSVFAEEWGLVGSMFLLALFGLLILWGVRSAWLARDRFGALIASGVTGMLALYIVINVAMVLGFAPVVEVPLPFISYGGSAMLTLSVGVGLLLNVRRGEVWLR